MIQTNNSSTKDSKAVLSYLRKIQVTKTNKIYRHIIYKKLKQLLCTNFEN